MKRCISPVLFILVGILAIMGLLGRLPGPNYLKAWRIANAIRSELPLGSTKAQVEAFLRSKSLEHSPYISDKEDLEMATVVRGSSYQVTDLGGVMLMIIRKTSWGIISHTDIQHVFFFDKKERLIEHKAYVVGTSL